jgi:hypothetical protein
VKVYAAFALSKLRGLNKWSKILSSRFSGNSNIHGGKRTMRHIMLGLLNLNFVGAVAFPALYHVGRWMSGTHHCAPEKAQEEQEPK